MVWGPLMECFTSFHTHKYLINNLLDVLFLHELTYLDSLFIDRHLQCCCIVSHMFFFQKCSDIRVLCSIMVSKAAPCMWASVLDMVVTVSSPILVDFCRMSSLTSLSFLYTIHCQIKATLATKPFENCSHI